MKQKFTKCISALCLVVCVMFSCCVTCFQVAAVEDAAIQCYLIDSTQNVPVYEDSSLTKKIGSVFPSDELQVLLVKEDYVKVRYVITGTNQFKTGYIHRNTVLTCTTGETITSSERITTYKRPNGASYGAVFAGDAVKLLGSSKDGNWIQVKYSIGANRYKYAWIKSDDVTKYLCGIVDGGIYIIHTAMQKGVVLDAYLGSNPDLFLNLQLCSRNNGVNQGHLFESVGNGWYIITNLYDRSQALTIVEDNNVTLRPKTYGEEQLFQPKYAGNGCFYLMSKLPGNLALDVYGGHTIADETNVIAYPLHGGTNQQWYLELLGQEQKTPTQSTPTTAVPMSAALYGNSGGRLTCKFDGYVNQNGRHEGIDFAKGYGVEIYSLTEGVITRVTKGYEGSNGLSTIALYDENTDSTIVYLHTHPLENLYVGQYIQKGQPIATESNRGASAAHTHIEVRKGRKTAAAKSVNDYTLENEDPTAFWQSKGYIIQ